MSSTFFGLNLGLKGLQAQQKAIDVTGHNISNANTAGYSKQTAVLTASLPLDSYPAGQVGTGVDVASVSRAQDSFLDSQMRYALSEKGTWESKGGVLHNLEAIINEPSDNGVSSMMGKFWDAWQELTKNPESSSARVSLRETAATFARTVRETYSQVEGLITDTESSINVKVNGINDTLKKISEINKQIQDATVSGEQPNDLLDKRDTMLEDLSKVTDYQANFSADGEAQIYISGRQVLSKNSINSISMQKNGSDLTFTTQDGADIQFKKGEINGLMSARSEMQSKYLAGLDQLADTITKQVNNLHQSGYTLSTDPLKHTGVNFFKPPVLPATSVSAKNFDLDPAIYSDAANIAASKTDDGLGTTIVGDSQNALAIAQLRQGKFLSDNTANFDDYYKNLVSNLGVTAQESYRMHDNQDSIIYQINQRRESVRGVSLDEEMTNLVQFQRAYQASARVITTMDDMLDTIINKMVR